MNIDFQLKISERKSAPRKPLHKMPHNYSASTQIVLISLAIIGFASLLVMAGSKGGDEGSDIILYNNNLVIRGNGGKGKGKGKGEGGGNLVIAEQQHESHEKHHHHGFDDGHFGGHQYLYGDSKMGHYGHDSFEQKLIREIIMGGEEGRGTANARTGRVSGRTSSRSGNNNNEQKKRDQISWGQVLLGNAGSAH